MQISMKIGSLARCTSFRMRSWEPQAERQCASPASSLVRTQAAAGGSPPSARYSARGPAPTLLGSTCRGQGVAAKQQHNWVLP